MSKPKITIAIPFHWMDNWPFFLERCLKSIEAQTFKDYEIVMIKHSSMPTTSNRTIESAKGEIVKMLYMDDYLADENALQHLVDSWRGGWAVSGCIHNDGTTLSDAHFPKWSMEVFQGVNLIGSPSVLAFENNDPGFFDERMSWMLDLDLYRDLFTRYGEPTIINHLDVGIGVGSHQMTQKLTSEEKETEVKLFHGAN